MPTAGKPSSRWLPDMDEEPDIGERERLEQVIVLCRKRVARADEKLAAAQAEREAAGHALDGQQDRLAQWHKDNPDPQGSIFEELSNV